MSNHTPGPWIFENRDGDHPLNDQNGWGCDGLWAVNGGFILGAGPGWDATYQNPTKANARLIVAAPDMYEAAKVQQECGLPSKVTMYDEDGCEGWLWSHPDGREWVELGDWSEPPTLHPLMRAAIAKIEGGGE